MNEITSIHLGRQPYTIAVDAHKALRDYLDAISSQMQDKGVVEEVELRMAELLAEHGITGDKVILRKDVDFLKQQLGSPQDFNDGKSPDTSAEPPTGTKRLFRDTNNAMIAGVAAGLARYFGLDVLLVRLLFVVAVLSGGWGIVIYIALWLLVPEAKTSSEKLQMAGEPINIHSLKQAVNRADIAGAAKRANQSLAGPVNALFRVILKVVGLSLIIVSLSILFALLAAQSYVLLHSGNLFGQDIFPVGFREHVLLTAGITVAALLSVLVIVMGVAIFKQKWPIKLWLTGTVVGLALIGLAGTVALAIDAAPQIHDRYTAQLHATSRTLPAFSVVKTTGDAVTVRFRSGSSYGVQFSYFGNPNFGAITTRVSNGTLLIDSSHFIRQRDCSFVCIPDTYNVVVTVYSPVPLTVQQRPGLKVPAIPTTAPVLKTKLY